MRYMEPQSTSILASLGINGWQFAAQLVNFSIVLFVMWKFVFTPLLKLMDARAKRIADGLTHAETAAKKLEEASTEKEQVLIEARRAAQMIVDEGRANGEAIRQEKLKIAMREIEQHIDEAKMQIKAEKDAAAASLHKEMATLITSAVEKVAVGLDEKSMKALAAQATEEVGSTK